jgi:hypothetical protein
MQRNPLVLAAMLTAVGVLGATSVAAAAPAATRTRPVRRHSTLAGNWSGRYGGAFSGTFALHWTQSGSRLHGSITLSNPRGKYGISGSVHGKAIKFGAVGAGATYTGSVSGKSMSGSYRSPGGGGSWSAHKTS